MSEQSDDLQPYLTSREVCSFLNISKITLERYCAAGRLKYFKLPGGDRRFELADVKAVLTRGDVEAERRERQLRAVAVNNGMSAEEAAATSFDAELGQPAGGERG